MRELITKIDEDIYHTNDLTREMDSLRIIEDPYGCTYIYREPYKFEDHYKWLIRYPGATRGNIQVDFNGIITGIDLYDDEYHTDDIYVENIRDIFSKYIGMKYVII